MVDHSDEPRLTTPIVPDADSDLAGRHYPPPARRRRTRTWPLWLLCLLLCVGLIAMGVYYWFDRQTWLANQRQLEGQVSNMHARLDSFDNSHDDSSDVIKQQLDKMQTSQQALQKQFAELETTLHSLEDSRVDNAAFRDLSENFQTAEKERDTLAATLKAMQRSLDILEQSGKDARGALGVRLASLEALNQQAEQRRQALSAADDQIGTRLDSLAETQQALQASVTSLSRQDDGEAVATLASRLDELASAVETLRDDTSGQQERWDQLSSRIEGMRASVTELRQNQLALNASIESLDSRVDR